MQWPACKRIFPLNFSFSKTWKGVIAMDGQFNVGWALCDDEISQRNRVNNMQK